MDVAAAAIAELLLAGRPQAESRVVADREPDAVLLGRQALEPDQLDVEALRRARSRVSSVTSLKPVIVAVSQCDPEPLPRMYQCPRERSIGITTRSPEGYVVQMPGMGATMRRVLFAYAVVVGPGLAYFIYIGLSHH